MLLAYEFVIAPGPRELLTKIPYWASCGRSPAARRARTALVVQHRLAVPVGLWTVRQPG
jgi:hypothetical protein